MAPNEEFHISVVADGREGDFRLRTRVDKVLPKSIITKEKADLTQGISVEIPAALKLQDSKGIFYSTQHSITLRCESGGSPQSFSEIFYIVDRCELDALLRCDISNVKPKNEPKGLPLYFGQKTEDQAKTQAKAVLQAEQRNRELKNKDKANDLKDQPLPRKENKSDTSLRS